MLREKAKQSVREALKTASELQKPEIDTLFEDVYNEMPAHLKDQREQLKQHLRKYPEHYNLKNFVNGEGWPQSQ